LEFNVPFHYKYGYIRDEGAVRNNFKVHSGEKTTRQCPGMIAEKDVFYVYDESLTVTRRSWCCPGDYSRVSDRLRRATAPRQWQDVTGDHELTGGRRAETTLRRNVSNSTQRVRELGSQ